MADAIAPGITAGGNLIGGGIEAIGEGAANRREARLSATQAGTLSEFLANQVMPSNYTGLENEASRLITRGQAGLNASMGAQGLAGSGGYAQAGMGLRGEVLGGLAEQINADQVNRATLGAQILSNPVFGFYDQGTGTPTNQQSK